MENLDKYGGRKFLYAILVVVLGFVFVCIGATTSDLWFDFAKFMGVVYVAGNVAVDGISIIKGK